MATLLLEGYEIRGRNNDRKYDGLGELYDATSLSDKKHVLVRKAHENEADLFYRAYFYALLCSKSGTVDHVAHSMFLKRGPILVSFDLEQPLVNAVPKKGWRSISSRKAKKKGDIMLKFMEFALDAATGLEEIHESIPLHNFINHVSVLYSPETNKVKYSSFQYALTAKDDILMNKIVRNRDDEFASYESPESLSVHAESVDFRSDFYSLGNLLLYVWTGSYSTSIQMKEGALDQDEGENDDDAPALPQSMIEIIRILLEPLPDERYQSGEHLVEDIKTCITEYKAGNHSFVLNPSHKERGVTKNRNGNVSSKIYGRDTICSNVSAILSSSVTMGSAAGSIFFEGAAGSGKSRLLEYAANLAQAQTRDSTIGVARCEESVVQDTLVRCLDMMLFRMCENKAWRAGIESIIQSYGYKVCVAAVPGIRSIDIGGSTMNTPLFQSPSYVSQISHGSAQGISRNEPSPSRTQTPSLPTSLSSSDAHRGKKAADANPSPSPSFHDDSEHSDFSQRHVKDDSVIGIKYKGASDIDIDIDGDSAVTGASIGSGSGVLRSSQSYSQYSHSQSRPKLNSATGSYAVSDIAEMADLDMSGMSGHPHTQSMDLDGDCDSDSGSMDVSPESDPVSQRKKVFDCRIDFVKVCAAMCPSSICLDDIHYADTETLKFILTLIKERIHRLSIVVTCRTLTVNAPATSHVTSIGSPSDPSDSKVALLREIKENSNAVFDVSPLQKNDIQDWLDDMFPMDSSMLSKLTKLTFDKTGGNCLLISSFIDQCLVKDHTVKSKSRSSSPATTHTHTPSTLRRGRPALPPIPESPESSTLPSSTDGIGKIGKGKSEGGGEGNPIVKTIQWDLPKLKKVNLDIRDPLVESASSSFFGLNPLTLRLLQLAGCIGMKIGLFDMTTILQTCSVVLKSKNEPGQKKALKTPYVTKKMVSLIFQGTDVKQVLSSSSSSEKNFSNNQGLDSLTLFTSRLLEEAIDRRILAIQTDGYGFSSRRIRDAVISMIPAHIHVQMKTVLGCIFMDSPLHSVIAATQFNSIHKSVLDVVDEDDRVPFIIDIVRLEESAARKALRHFNFDSYRNFGYWATVFIKKIPDAWTTKHHETFNAYFHWVEALSFSGKLSSTVYARAIDELGRNALTVSEKISVLHIQIHRAQLDADYKEMRALGFKALEVLELGKYPSSHEEVLAEIRTIINEVDIDLLDSVDTWPSVDESVKSQKHHDLIIQWMSHIALSSFMDIDCQPKYLWIWFALTGLKIFLENRKFTSSISILLSWAGAACPFLGEYEKAKRLSEYAVKLYHQDLKQANKEVARVNNAFYTTHYFKPFSEMIGEMIESHANLLGDLNASQLTYRMYSAISVARIKLYASTPLDEIHQDSIKLMSQLIDNDQDVFANTVFKPNYLQLVKCLLGKTKSPGSLDSSDFSEAEYHQSVERTYFYIDAIFVKLMTLFWCGDYEGGMHWVKKAEDRSVCATDGLCQIHIIFYCALHLIEHALRLPVSETDERSQLIQRIKMNMKQLKLAAIQYEQNYLHKYLLVRAGLFELNGQIGKALICYQKCIDSTDMLNIRGLAHEMIGHMILKQYLKSQDVSIHLTMTTDNDDDDEDDIGISDEDSMMSAFQDLLLCGAYLKKARKFYVKWACRARVKQFDIEYSDIQDTYRDSAGVIDSGNMRFSVFSMASNSPAQTPSRNLSRSASSSKQSQISMPSPSFSDLGVERRKAGAVGVGVNDGPSSHTVDDWAVMNMIAARANRIQMQNELEEKNGNDNDAGRNITRVHSSNVSTRSCSSSSRSASALNNMIGDALSGGDGDDDDDLGIGIAVDYDEHGVRDINGYPSISLCDIWPHRFSDFLFSAPFGVMVADFAPIVTRTKDFLAKQGHNVSSPWKRLISDWNDVSDGKGEGEDVKYHRLYLNEIGREWLFDDGYVGVGSVFKDSLDLVYSLVSGVHRFTQDNVSVIDSSGITRSLTVMWEVLPEYANGSRVIGIMFEKSEHALEKERSYIKTLEMNARELEIATAEKFAAMRDVERSQMQQANELNRIQKYQVRFLDTLCHELRNPLNGLLAGVEILAATSQEPRSGIRDVQSCAGHLRVIIDDVLDYSRLKEGDSGAVNYVPYKPYEVANLCYTMFRSAAEAKNLDLRLNVDLSSSPSSSSSDTVVKGDPNRVAQVLSNLLSNAIKFTPGGGVIKFSVTMKSAKLVMSVEDSGIGIDDGHLQNIFSPFQFSRTSDSGFGGSGLGLSISQQLVQRMGGDISVTSEEKVGTKFVVVIPCEILNVGEMTSSESSSTNQTESQLNTSKSQGSSYSSSARTSTSTSQSARQPSDSDGPGVSITRHMKSMISRLQNALLPDDDDDDQEHGDGDGKGGGKVEVEARKQKQVTRSISAQSDQIRDSKHLRILCADDAVINRRVLKGLLNLVGYEKITVAENGQDAVDKFKAAQGEFDLVLMDIEMPVLDGFDASDAIQQWLSASDRPNVPIYALSGFVSDAHMEKAQKVGMSGYLTKPIDKERLIAVMEEAASRIPVQIHEADCV